MGFRRPILQASYLSCSGGVGIKTILNLATIVQPRKHREDSYKVTEIDLLSAHSWPIGKHSGTNMLTPDDGNVSWGVELDGTKAEYFGSCRDI